MNEIPYEILLPVLKPEIREKYKGSKLITEFYNRKKTNSATVINNLNIHCNLDIMFLDNSQNRNEKTGILKLDDFETMVIRNTELTIEIPDISFNMRYKYGYWLVPVIVHSKELDTLGYDVVVKISLTKFLFTISKAGVDNHTMIGTFCFSGAGALTMIELEDKNTVLSEKAYIGQLLATSKKTTKWKPGYTYLLNNGTPVLYLGKIKVRQIDSLSYYCRMPNRHSLVWRTICGSIKYGNSNTEVHLYVDCKLTDTFAYGTVYDTLTILLQQLSLCEFNVMHTLPSSVELKKHCEDDGRNITDPIVSAYMNGAKQVGQERSLEYLYAVSAAINDQKVKEFVINHFKTIILDLLKLSKYKTIDELIKAIDDAWSYHCLKDIKYQTLIPFTNEEFKNLLKESLNL